MSITYEWLVEEIDAADDIIDVCHFDEASDALNHANEVRARGGRTNIGIVRDRIDRSGGLDRAWAYLVDGKLGEEFLDACDEPVARIPVRFLLELEEAQKPS